MKANCYTQFLADAAHRFRHFTSKAALMADEDAIHEFRVAFKEIEAFHQILLLVANDNQKKAIAHWQHGARHIYKPAGKLRNALMIHKLGCLADTWNLLPNNEIALLTNIEERKDAFLSLAQNAEVPNINKSETLLASISHDVDQLIATILIDHFHQAVNQLNLPSGLHWHEARRLLKMNYYLLKALKNGSPMKVAHEKIILTGIIEKELGRWHDWTLLQQFIQQTEADSPQKGHAMNNIQQHIIDIEENIVTRAKLFDSEHFIC